MPTATKTAPLLAPLVALLFVVLTPAVVTVVDGGLEVGIAAASAAQLALTWTDNAQGTAVVKVERKTGASGTFAHIATTAMGATSYADATVTAGTTYCYRIRASNSAGDSAYSNEACTRAATSPTVTVK